MAASWFSRYATPTSIVNRIKIPQAEMDKEVSTACQVQLQSPAAWFSPQEQN